MKRLENKVAVVVGSTSGIGQTIAEMYAAEGAKVIVSGRRDSQGQQVTVGIRNNGGEAEFIKCDVTKVEECQNLIDKAIEIYGKLDILVYNSGAFGADYLDNTTEAKWDQIFDVNCKGAFFMIQHAMAELIKTKGNIVMTCSGAGISANVAQGCVAYGGSKAAVGQMTKVLASTYAKQGVRVNAIAPGCIKTSVFDGLDEATLGYLASMIPMQRMGETKDIANAAIFLASDEASFITGQILAVCGGQTIG